MNPAEKKLFEAIGSAKKLVLDTNSTWSTNYSDLRYSKAGKTILEAMAEGAVLTALDEEGQTLMHVASKADAADYMVALAQVGLDPNARDSRGDTAMRALEKRIGEAYSADAHGTSWLLGRLGWLSRGSEDEAAAGVVRHEAPSRLEIAMSKGALVEKLKLGDEFVEALELNGALRKTFAGIVFAVSIEPKLNIKYVSHALSRAFAAPDPWRKALQETLATLAGEPAVAVGMSDSCFLGGFPVMDLKCFRDVFTLAFSLGEMGSALGHYPTDESGPLGQMALEMDVADVERLVSQQAQYMKWLGVPEALCALQAIDMASEGAVLEGGHHSKGEGWNRSLDTYFRDKLWSKGDPQDETYCASRLAGFSRGLGLLRKVKYGALGDPMTSLASDVLDLAGESKSVATDAVGRARQILMESFGLGKGGWRAMVLDEALREKFEAVVKRVAASGKSEYAREGPSGNEYGSGKASVGSKRLDVGDEKILRSCCALLNHGAEHGAEPSVLAQLLSYGSWKGSALSSLLLGKSPALSAAFKTMSGSPKEMEALRSEAQAFERVRSALLRDVVKAAGEKASEQNDGSSVHKAMNDLNDLAECAKKSPPGFWGMLDENSPFAHGKNIHDDWVAQMNERQVAAAAAARNAGGSVAEKTWTGVLCAVDGVSKGVEAKELVSALDLAEEGRVLSHCVLSYADACRRGSSRIISLSKGGQKLSTVELAPIGAQGERLSAVDFDDEASRAKVVGWALVQHRGKMNAAVADDDLLASARWLADAATRDFAGLKKSEVESEPVRPKAVV